ncbi:RHS repeat-associated core domain-containing protein, partial [Winogradskyella sp.]|uniref:RHS repeat-associated core domain-containing protein n=1 Tax=Winogradskyella sp. TaxID=1883156 RepID=UPI00263566BD
EYAYNVRGWLKNINNTGNLGDDLFAFKIKYTDTDNPSGVGLFNGNIAEVDWRTASDNTWFRYTYHYDALNRITKADFNGGSTGMGTRYRLSNVDYDKNGNIKALERNGHIVADPNRNTSSDFGPMDNLVYTYEARSNRLKKVLDNGSDGHGFKDGADVATEYTYDANGNMLRDLNKGISSNISYNHLNLPTQVTLSGGNIQYIYDATGVKQKKIVSTGTTTEYAGNFIYENGSLKMFSHLEGYVEPAAKAGTYNYAYQYRDHLGNIRLTYMDVNQNNPSAVSLEILEENNYYPFGLKHKGYNDVVSANVNSVARKFGFQEQELNDELGLNWHSYKFRNYDAAIGRFFNIDPLTEDYMDWGPYVFSGNRVIDARELEGLEPFFVNYDMTFKENVETNVNAYVEAGKSISKTAEFILNPVETVKGLWNLGKALLNPVDTAEAIVDNVSQTIEDTQSTDPDVAGPALGKIMAFTAETAAGFELGNISKISKVTTVADDLVSGIVKNADDVSAFASKNQIFSAQTGVDTSKIGEYLTQMRSGNFSSSSGAAGVIHNGKYILTEGNHRMNAAIRYGLETGDLKYAQQLIDNGNFQIRNPSDLGLSVNKFPVK